MMSERYCPSCHKMSRVCEHIDADLSFHAELVRTIEREKDYWEEAADDSRIIGAVIKSVFQNLHRIATGSKRGVEKREMLKEEKELRAYLRRYPIGNKELHLRQFRLVDALVRAVYEDAEKNKGVRKDGL